MILFNQDNTFQAFALIPFNFTADRIYLLRVFDKQTKKTTEVGSYDFTVFPNERDLVYIGNLFLSAPDIIYEGGSYIITLLDDDFKELFKDNAFCTNQPKVSYDINNGEYQKLNTNNNEFIVL